MAVLALCGIAPAFAQGVPAGDDPSPRAGRVASFDGQLFVAPQDRAEEWTGIGLNYPVATGDNLWIGADGRAEVDYGAGQFRLGADSSVHVSRLDERQLALFVAQGRVVVRVRSLDPGEAARVDTPNAQIEILRPGLYRIDVSPEPRQTWLMVREGEANVALPSGLQQVLPGQTATIAGADSAVAEVRNGVTVDGLDGWSADRDRVYERGRQATSYVSRQMVGYADLDANGRWETAPEYGAVWFPAAVADDWAPYRYGRWTWVTQYGWTWVDDAPWGYAPFHYGRWAHIGGRWGWCPGTYVARPIWAPALVAWYGGNGWSAAAGQGGPVFGWVPLGWRDPVVPWWGRCGANCYARYNRPYAVNLAERSSRPTYYANGGVAGAVTAVGGAAFRGGKPVATNRVPIAPGALASAPLLFAAPSVQPLPVGDGALRPGRGVPVPAATVAAQVRPSAVAPVMAVPGTPAYDRTGRSVLAAPAIDSVGPGARPGAAAQGLPGRPANAAPGAAYDSRALARPGRERPALQETGPSAGAVSRPLPAPPVMAAPPAPLTGARNEIRIAPGASVEPPMVRGASPAATPAPVIRSVSPGPPAIAPSSRSAPVQNAQPIERPMDRPIDRPIERPMRALPPQAIVLPPPRMVQPPPVQVAPPPAPVSPASHPEAAKPAQPVHPGVPKNPVNPS